MYICVVNIELILMFKWKLWIVLFFLDIYIFIKLISESISFEEKKNVLVVKIFKYNKNKIKIEVLMNVFNLG